MSTGLAAHSWTIHSRPRPSRAAASAGSYVKAEKQTLAEFLVKDWLPSRRPPVLEESTWVSYDRYIRLHVLPWIGVIPLQQLSPVDLNTLYRRLLESDRQRPGPPKRHPPELHQRANVLRTEGQTWRTDRFDAAARVPRRRRHDHAVRRRCAPTPWNAEELRSRRAARTLAADCSLHPRDPARCLEGRAAMEPCGAQRRRRGDAAVNHDGQGAADEGMDGRAAPVVPAVQRRKPLPACVAFPGDERLPPRRVPSGCDGAMSISMVRRP